MGVEIYDERLRSLTSKLSGTVLVDEFRKINNAYSSSLTKDVLHYSFPNNRPVYIIPLSDAHIGSVVCNKDKFKAIVDLIAKQEDVYTILLGDLAESATKTSIGAGMFDEDIHVEDQIDYICRILQPLSDQRKILAMITGNHETRIRVIAGIDISKIIASRLNVPYCGYSSYLSLDVGAQNYTIAATHGSGNGTTSTGKIRAAEKLKENVLVDIFLSGHTHYRSYHDDVIDIIEGDHVKHHRRHYIACGSYLEYVGSYGEMKGYPLAISGTVIIQLDPNEKDVRVAF